MKNGFSTITPEIKSLSKSYENASNYFGVLLFRSFRLPFLEKNLKNSMEFIEMCLNSGNLLTRN